VTNRWRTRSRRLQNHAGRSAAAQCMWMLRPRYRRACRRRADIGRLPGSAAANKSADTILIMPDREHVADRGEVACLRQACDGGVSAAGTAVCDLRQHITQESRSLRQRSPQQWRQLCLPGFRSRLPHRAPAGIGLSSDIFSASPPVPRKGTTSRPRFFASAVAYVPPASTRITALLL